MDLKPHICKFLIGYSVLAIHGASAEGTNSGFSFSARGTGGDAPARAGMFYGVSGDAILVGGGLDAQGVPSSDVYVTAGGKAPVAAHLAQPVAFAGYVSATLRGEKGDVSKLVVVGGLGAAGLGSGVRSLEWRDGKLVEEILPSLPVPLISPGVGCFEDQNARQIYVFGGAESRTADKASAALYRLAFKEGKPQAWKTMPPFPGEGRLFPGVLCFDNDVHIFGGYKITAGAGGSAHIPTDEVFAYRWKVIDGTTFTGWKKLRPLPLALAAPVVFQSGQAHCALTGGRAGPMTGDLFGSTPLVPDNRDLFIYHSVTDTWVGLGTLPEPASGGASMSTFGKRLLVAQSATGKPLSYDVELLRTVKSLRWQDYTSLFVYFSIVAFSGIYFTRKQTGSEGFALGDRKIPWWMAGISMFASAASSISFMAIPALAFRTSLIWALPSLVLIPLFFLEAYVLYPLIRKLEITSTFEYLERRFHPSLRYIASAQAIALQTFGRMNMVLLLPALAIAAVTGMNVYASVLLMGVVTTIYSAKGGMKAVVLTEVIQGITMVVGISLIVILAITGLPHGWKSFVDVDTHFQKFNLGIWSLDYTMPIIWILILTPLFNKLAFAADAPTVQRVFATPLKDVRKLALIFLCFSVFISIAVNFAGISVFAYFHQHPAELDPAMTNDQIIPLYIVQRLPVGIAGLIIASLFAAAMSALAGSMNTVSILFTEDFYRKLRKNTSDRERLLTMRVASLVAGTAATLCALYMAKLNQRSLFQTWNELFALLGGGFLGIYILGTYTHRANAIGAFTGAVASIGVTLGMKYFTAVHWYFYTPGAVISCVVIGYVVSLFTPSSKHSLAGLTIFDMKQEAVGEGGNPTKK